MTNKNNNRGSEWRKWDLHIHSPKCFLNNRFGESSIDDFVAKICQSEIVAVGLTNYFRFSDSDLGEVKDKLTQKGVAVFPNLEFRIQQKNKDNEEIHIHILFSNEVSKDRITNFLTRLKTIDGKCCKDLKKEDIKTTSIDISTLEETLKKDTDIEHLKDYLFVACPRGQGSFRPSSNDDGRGNTNAIRIDKFSDMLFGKSKDTDFFLNKDRYKNAKQKTSFIMF